MKPLLACTALAAYRVEQVSDGVSGQVGRQRERDNAHARQQQRMYGVSERPPQPPAQLLHQPHGIQRGLEVGALLQARQRVPVRVWRVLVIEHRHRYLLDG